MTTVTRVFCVCDRLQVSVSVWFNDAPHYRLQQALFVVGQLHMKNSVDEGD